MTVISMKDFLKARGEAPRRRSGMASASIVEIKAVTKLPGGGAWYHEAAISEAATDKATPPPH